MTTEYPDFKLTLEAGAVGDVAFWQGIIQPVKLLTSLSAVLEDVEAERPVRVVRGEIIHHPNCRFKHLRHPLLSRLIYWRTRFEIRVEYDGGPGDPRCSVLYPPIPQDKRRHVWADGTICPFMSSDAWNPDRDDVVDVLGHATIWLLKWNVFDQTGAWIGREHHGTPEYHLKALEYDDRCWCRSGRRYRSCHHTSDQRLVQATPSASSAVAYK